MNRLPFCAYCPRETCIYTEGQRPVAACFGHRDYDASATLQASVIVHENRERLFYAISEKNVAISKARDIMQTGASPTCGSKFPASTPAASAP